MRKVILLLMVALLAGVSGCVGSSQATPTKPSPAQEPQPQVAEPAPLPKPQVPAKEEFKYPSHLADIKQIYSKLSQLTKDEFTTTEEYNSIVARAVKPLMGPNNYAAFRISEWKDVDGSIIPSIYWDADSGVGRLTMRTDTVTYFPARLHFGSFYQVAYDTRTTVETGRTALGVTQSYDMDKGTRFGLHLYGVDIVGMGWPKVKISSDEARRLKNNTEVIFLVKLGAFGKIPPTFEDINSSTPKLGDVRAWSYQEKIVTGKLKAILICDKTKKEVMYTIYPDEFK